MSEEQYRIPLGLARRVSAGVAVLDEEMPGWHDRVDVETLDVGSCVLCVLGQLCGSYYDALTTVRIAALTKVKPYELAFDTVTWEDEDSEREVAALNRLWSFVIRQRQAVAQ